VPSPLLDLFVPTFERRPDAPLIVRGGLVESTYGDLVGEVRRLAAALRARGVEPGARVSVQVDKSVHVLELYLATLWAGGVFHPMNPAYSAEESAYLLDDAEPAITVRSAEQLDDLLAAAADASPLDDSMARTPDDLAALLYTSGTTGRPKGAMITHGNLASNAAALVDAWGFGPDDALLHVLPVFHAHGLFVACNTSLANGTPIVWHDRFDGAEVVDVLADRRPGAIHPTVVMGVPTHYTRLLADDRLDRTVTAGIRLFVSGSAPLQATTHASFEARTGQRILERYGMTETQMITSNPLRGERLAGTVGFPLPGVEVRVVDEGGAIAGAGAVGGVEVRGPNVCAGYWRQPERRAVDFTADGWFRTGDTGVLAADGRLRLVGRAKDLIISGGYNVYPAEIERVLDTLPGVAESAVVGMPHPDFGESGLALIVVEAGGPQPDPDALLAELRAHLASYKVPRLVVVVDELPRNAMGKVQKNLLRDEHSATWRAHLAAVET